MKKNYLLGLIGIILFSCSKEELITESISSVNEEIKIINFISPKEMEDRINKIISLKEQKEKIVLGNFESMEKSKITVLGNGVTKGQGSVLSEEIIKDLKRYHNEKLSSICELRKELNFTSIQSIADEINSLILVDSSRAKKLFIKHKKFLLKTKIEVETIFDDRSANVINTEGEVLVKGEKLNFRKSVSSSQTGKYIGDESIKSGIAANSGDFFVYYFAGREVHKNFIGVKYFKYFTQLKSYLATANGLVACPSIFVVNNGSIAGFVQTGSQFFSDYAFSYPYISGSGTSVRYAGGDKNTPYIPAGGKISGVFSTTIGGVYKEVTCNMQYSE